MVNEKEGLLFNWLLGQAAPGSDAEQHERTLEMVALSQTLPGLSQGGGSSLVS